MLYTGRWRSLTLIWTEGVDSEVGSCPLPWGVVMSKEEKRRSLALSLTHRVGGVNYWSWRGVEVGFLRDLPTIPLMRRVEVVDHGVYGSGSRTWCTYVPQLNVSGCTL